METKMCSKCKTPKLTTEMVRHKGSSDGLSSWCLECHRKVTTQQQHTKQALVNSFKIGPCTDCHLVFPTCCMDFDHVFGTKFRGIGQLMTSRKDESILREMSKCELVCSVCHRLRTNIRNGEPKSKRWLSFYSKLKPLKESPCVDCGLSFHPCCMDFDHVRGDKVLVISKMFTCSWERVLQEIEKCDLVCANCHRIRTNLRRILEAA